MKGYGIWKRKGRGLEVEKERGNDVIYIINMKSKIITFKSNWLFPSNNGETHTSFVKGSNSECTEEAKCTLISVPYDR